MGMASQARSELRNQREKEREMELKFIEDKSSSRRDFRPPSQRVRSQKNVRSNLLDAIAQVHGSLGVSQCEEDGVMRMKIMLTKQQLKHLMLMMGNEKNDVHHHALASATMSSSSLEQRIRAMQKRRQRRSDQLRRGQGRWRPVLQSIPEEH